jgi:predicted porin
MNKFKVDSHKARSVGADNVLDHEEVAKSCTPKRRSGKSAATTLRGTALQKALVSVAALTIATAAHAGDSVDVTKRPEQLRQQNQKVTKKIVELEQRLQRLERKPASQLAVTAPPPGPLTNSKPVYNKAPSLLADDGSLTYHGITLYGTIDTGLTYQNHGAALNQNVGLAYLISKNSNGQYFGVAPSALSASNIGLKGTEELFPGISGVFNLQTSFVPTSGKLFDGLGSIVQNNGLPLTSQTTFADSSKDGQALNTAAYAGLSSPTFGTLTYGRQNSLTLDGVLAYDPMSGSGAFSVIGFQGATAGMGDTENARLDNSLKYSVGFGPFRAAAAAQLSPNGDGSRDIVQGELGVDYLGASFDAIYGKVRDAISAAPLPVGFAPSSTQLGNAGAGLVAGTVSDNTGLMLLARYTIGPVKLYAGYENIEFANPSIPLSVGSTIIGGYTLGTVNNTAFTNRKDLQVFWTGAKYSVRSDLDLIAAYYHEGQNSFAGNGCSNASLPQCSGQLNAVSLVLDYRFAKRWDAYAGAMYSKVSNGLASGFLNTSTIDPTVGLRFQF